jgi:general stress protein 26
MYKKEFERLFNVIGKAQKMTLATSSNNHVTARTMSFIIEDEKLYFQTDSKFNKMQQIEVNPLVAVCWNNIQVEGRCEILGHPLEASNLFFREAFEKYYPGSYEKYSHLESEVVIRVIPNMITTWEYDNGRPYREFFSFEDRYYYKEYYR